MSGLANLDQKGNGFFPLPFLLRYTTDMTVLKWFMVILLLGHLLVLGRLTYLGGWVNWLCAAICGGTIYALAEITHTIFTRKPRLPMPTSLEFEKLIQQFRR